MQKLLKNIKRCPQHISDKLLPVMMAVILGTMFSASATFAQVIQPTCDPAYWGQLKERAWLEAQREVTQNQNLIFKADSILSYTCFPEWAAQAASVGSLFSGGGLVGAVNSLAVGPARNYVATNFTPGNYLGGRYPSGAVCDLMRAVWARAKCQNFIDTGFAGGGALDGFYTFLELQDNAADPRLYPTPCGKVGTWETSLQAAMNTPDVRTTGIRVDNVANLRNPYLEHRRTLITPRLIPGACAPAIMTGVEVHTSPGAEGEFPDGICTNPGCVYLRSGACAN